MNELQIFNSEEFGEIRTITKDSKTYFAGSDVAKALGYAIPHKAVQTHCKGVLKWNIPTNSGNQDILFITEGDIYRLIMKSKLPKAEEFERWVMEEVLPSIRKNGGYIAGQETLSDEWNGVNGRPYDLCPKCNTNLCCEMPYDNKPKYCKHCGQKLDWSDEE